MSESIWAVLGIAPTADLLAIKRAYAARLKRTRPDDDAQAYQALREAYEQAQQWARWKAEDGDDDEGVVDAPVDQPAAPVVAPERAPADGRTLAAADLDADPPAAMSIPEAAVSQEAPQTAPELVWVDTITPAMEALDAAWAEGGSLAVLAAWAPLQARWDEVPLDERGHLNVTVADWTLTRQTIRPELLQALAQQFAWTGDFRATRRLGWQRAQALQALMADTLDLRASNPALAVRLEPLRRLEQWRTTGALWRMLLCMVLMGEPLRQLLRECPAAVLHKLTARDDSFERLALWFKRAFWLRAGLPGLVVAGVLALHRGGWPDALFGGFIWFVLCLGLGTALVLMGRLIGAAWGLAAEGSPLRGRVLALLAHPWAWRWGAAALVAALALAVLPLPEDDPASAWQAGVGLLLWALGVAALWPRVPADGLVASGAAGLVFVLFAPVWRPWPLLALFVAVSLWALLAHRVFAAGLHAGRAGWPLRVLFGFVTTSFDLERQGGFLFALTPVAVVLTLHWLNVLVAPGWTVVAWMAAMHALSWAQVVANRWAAPRLGFDDA